MGGLSRITGENVIGHYSAGLITKQNREKQFATNSRCWNRSLSPFRLMTSAGAILVFSISVLFAEERPLIWEFSKNSDTAYSARLGSHLPTPRKSSIGAEMRLRGPDPESFGNPVSLWVSMQLAERERPSDAHAMDLSARLDGSGGNGSLSVRNSLARNWALLEAEVNHEISIEFRPAEERRRYVRQTQDVILKSPAARTEIRLHASRSGEEKWRTTVGFTQRLRNSIEISATLEEPETRNPTSRFGGRYHYQW